MPLYRLRQSGESTTLLPLATHIDIATAMTLWILGIGTSCGVCHPSMTTKVMALWTIMQHLPLTFFYASTLNVILQRLMPFYRLRQTGESTTLLLKATHIDIATAMALWILGIGTPCWLWSVKDNEK